MGFLFSFAQKHFGTLMTKRVMRSGQILNLILKVDVRRFTDG